ncbi:aldehyde dehydrogenase family protein, partial [Myxococcota bacterium]|nr:aldehyde dehydrogenase family protein [Myxococcota bacterium]
MTTIEGESRNLIDGQLVDASDGSTFENINPATEETNGVCADGTHADMDRALNAARRAFDETKWSTDSAFRTRCLEQFNAALIEAREVLRPVVVAEAGAPISLTHGFQLDHYIEAMPYWSNLAKDYPYETSMKDITFMGQPQARTMRREPVGVIGAITPWNVPVYLNLAKIGPALAAGNTVVMKPSDE